MCIRYQNGSLDGLIAHSPEAARLLEGFNLTAINDAVDVIYVLSPELTLVAFNQGWVRFALENGGEELLQRWLPGDSVLRAMPADIVEQTRQRYLEVLASQRPSAVEYDCSSPDAPRAFLEVVYPLRHGEGLLVTHSPVFDWRSDDPVVNLDRYRNAGGLLVQCSHCRRVARQDGSHGWDWLPGLALSVAATDISHTLCPWCLDHYHPLNDDERESTARC